MPTDTTRSSDFAAASCPADEAPLDVSRRARCHASSAVRRTPLGAIDVDYYQRRARLLRARWLRARLRRIVRRIVQAWRARRVASELRALDERSLRDLGIVRGDIEAIASGSYERDVTRRRRGVPDVAA